MNLIINNIDIYCLNRNFSNFNDNVDDYFRIRSKDEWRSIAKSLGVNYVITSSDVNLNLTLS